MKKIMALGLALLMLLGTFCVSPVFAADGTTICITPEDFKENLGSWKYQNDDGSKPFESMLIGRSDKAKDLLKPAGVNIDVPADGTYTVYVRTRDYATYPGTRQSQIAVNGTVLNKILGAHGTDGWAWETADSVSL